MQKNKIILRFLLAILFVFYSSAHALEITKNEQNHIVLEGKVERGDYAKLSLYLRNKYTSLPFVLNKIILNSPGGDVAEALLISNLIKTASGFTKVPEGGVCFSACFIIWSGGVMREVEKDAKLGVHRMTLSNENASVLKAEKIIKPLSNAVESYLLDVGIPRVIVDKMNETPPSDLFLMDLKWLMRNNLDYATNFSPYFIDVAEKKCGENAYVKFRKGDSSITGIELGQWMTCVNEFRKQNAMDNFVEFINLIAPKKK